MSDSLASLRHKINSAEELESVVHAMKAMASSSISQYENAVRSLDDYYRNIQVGLAACFHQTSPLASEAEQRVQKHEKSIGVIVFGSDQGLVGQFNEVMVEFVAEKLQQMPGKKILWSVGERIKFGLQEIDSLENNSKSEEGFSLPNSINSVSALVGQILIEIEAYQENEGIDEVFLFYHHPQARTIYEPVMQQLLPLGKAWRQNLRGIKWPTSNIPELLPNREQALRTLVREYLFVSLFRACAESLASENASRLSAMQRAEKNINELEEDLNRTFHRLRQSGIDEELFDVLSGFEALSK